MNARESITQSAFTLVVASTFGTGAVAIGAWLAGRPASAALFAGFTVGVWLTVAALLRLGGGSV